MKRDSCINLIAGHRLMILNYFKNKLINNVQYLLFPGQLINHSSHKSQQLLRCFAAFKSPDSVTGPTKTSLHQEMLLFLNNSLNMLLLTSVLS